MGVFESGVKQRIADNLKPKTWYTFEYLKEVTLYKRSILNSRGRDRFIEHLSRFAEVTHDKKKRGRSVYYAGEKLPAAANAPPPRIQYKKCVRVVIEKWQSKHRTKKTKKDMSYNDLYAMYYGFDIKKYLPRYEIYERIRTYRMYNRRAKYTNVYERIQPNDVEAFNRLLQQSAFYQVSKDIYEIGRTSNKVKKKHLLKNIKYNKTKSANKQEEQRIEYVFMKYGKGKTYMLNGEKYKMATTEIEQLCMGYAYRGVLYDIQFKASFPNREMYTDIIIYKKLFGQWKKIIGRFIKAIDDDETRKLYEAIYDLWKIHADELQKQIAKK